MSQKSKVLGFVLMLIFCLLSDRYTKQLAQKYLMHHEPISYLNNFFTLVYAENTGAALGMGDQLPQKISFWVLSIFPLIFLVAMFIYSLYKSSEYNMLKMLTLSIVIGGGLGNVIDRILYDRRVTDFMLLGIGDLKTGIFNVADVYVTFGIVGLLLFFKDKPKEKVSQF